MRDRNVVNVGYQHGLLFEIDGLKPARISFLELNK
jgi:hypothetical protein